MSIRQERVVSAFSDVTGWVEGGQHDDKVLSLPNDQHAAQLPGNLSPSLFLTFLLLPPLPFSSLPPSSSLSRFCLPCPSPSPFRACFTSIAFPLFSLSFPCPLLSLHSSLPCSHMRIPLSELADTCMPCALLPLAHPSSVSTPHLPEIKSPDIRSTKGRRSGSEG